jgi:hypothetical protein
MAARPRLQHLPDPVGWRDQLAECFRTIERRWLDKVLAGAAIVSSGSDDGRHEYVQHYRNVGNFLAHFEVRCFITPEEARTMREAWIRTEAELRLYRLPPVERRELLLDPTDGPQRFVTPRRRLQMLREIDVEALKNKWESTLSQAKPRRGEPR